MFLQRLFIMPFILRRYFGESNIAALKNEHTYNQTRDFYEPHPSTMAIWMKISYCHGRRFDKNSQEEGNIWCCSQAAFLLSEGNKPNTGYHNTLLYSAELHKKLKQMIELTWVRAIFEP